MDTDLGRQLGENLKQLRRERGLTLGQLAALAGLSKAMLSDMEKGGANPTVNTIWKLANGLKVPYTRLLEGEAPAATLVRGADLRPQTEGDGHYRVYCAFPGGGQRNFELFYMELDPQCAHTSAGTWPSPRSTSASSRASWWWRPGGSAIPWPRGTPWPLTPPRPTPIETPGTPPSGGSS